MENVESAVQSSKKSSSKTILIIVVLVIVVILGAGGYYFLSKGKQLKQTASDVAKQNTVPTQPANESMINSIKDALMGSQSLQCTFTDEQGRQIVSYIKSGAIRSDFTAPDPKQSGSMIYKDKKMYFWNGTQGTVMSFDMMATSESMTPPEKESQTSQANGQSPNDFVQELEKYKESCKQDTVADTIFVPPTNVKFNDISAMMNNVKQMMPSGVMPTGMSEEQMKAMEEKIQQ